ncbi:MAG: hypothetical protein JSR72_23470 [Proteobacteria bacterium]|nr:hypothetical protein [Pseudomonadota bacterium]
MNSSEPKLKEQLGRWTEEERESFKKALEKFGKNNLAELKKAVPQRNL